MSRYGPLDLVNVSSFPGGKHSPRKTIRTAMNTGKSTVLFDSSLPTVLQADVQQMQIDTVIMQPDQATALVVAHQLEELGLNSEWQRAGLHCRFRDTVLDGEDGFYFFRATDVAEAMLFAGDEQDTKTGIAHPRIDLDLYAREKPSVGVYVDQKPQVNDLNLGGLAVAALPAGLTAPYPASTWVLDGSDGPLYLMEQPPSIMQAKLSDPKALMIQGRCRVMDQTLTGT